MSAAAPPLRAAAPAKINRELRIGPRREDGFHDVLSRFVSIDLADELEARPGPELALVCEPGGLPPDRANLVFRAALALAERCGVPARAHLRLTKRIPIGAGLGGGSADAAAALRLLCRLWGAAPSEEDLAEVAASLGSDVPFFLLGGEADVSGRGERLSTLPDQPVRDLLLFVPPFAISTAEAYAAFDRLGGAGPIPQRLEVASSGRFLGPNDLERAAAAVRPEIRGYLDSARGVADESAMTGSGSAIVLAGAAPGARGELSRRHPEARVVACRTIGRETFRLRVAGVPPQA